MSLLNYNKKAISSVITTFLLIIVSVVSVVSFQDWYNSYQSNVFSNVEMKLDSKSSGEITIDNLIVDHLYVTNNLENEVNISSLKIGNNTCDVDENLAVGLNEIFVGKCINHLPAGDYETVLMTENDLIQKTIYIRYLIDREYPLLESDCAELPGSWILIPGNYDLGTSVFCVMQYEAKFVNYTGKSISASNTAVWNTATGDMSITSASSGYSIANINFTDAVDACESLGSGFSLISDEQWITIARNIEIQPSNWNLGTVYNGYIFPNTNLVLSTGENITDFSTNIHEFTNKYLNSTGTINSSLGRVSSAWIEWNTFDPNIYGSFMPIDTSLSSSENIGMVYVYVGSNIQGGSEHVFIRSIPIILGAYSGIYSLNLANGFSFQHALYGFRCVYNG